MDTLGVQSISIANLTCLFTGMVLALQTAYSLARVRREALRRPGRHPLPGARARARRSRLSCSRPACGAGITAELGTMAVTEQVDALRALGASPVRKLVLPRVVALTVDAPGPDAHRDLPRDARRAPHRRLRDQDRGELLPLDDPPGAHVQRPDARPLQDAVLRPRDRPHRLLQRPHGARAAPTASAGRRRSPSSSRRSPSSSPTSSSRSSSSPCRSDERPRHRAPRRLEVLRRQGRPRRRRPLRRGAARSSSSSAARDGKVGHAPAHERARRTPTPARSSSTGSRSRASPEEELVPGPEEGRDALPDGGPLRLDDGLRERRLRRSGSTRR